MIHPVSLACFAAAAALVAYGLRARSRARAAVSWPIVEGHVLLSTISVPTSRPTSYYAIVRYAYVVAGRRYESDQIAFGMESSSPHRGVIEQQIRAFPLGGTIPVRHDPRDPSVAVLQVGAAGSALPFFFAALLAFAGLVLMA